MAGFRLTLWIAVIGLSLAAAGCMGNRLALSNPETRAVDYLRREVPAWYRDNHCFSCHNNGDAARALLVARQEGFRVSAVELKNTLDWVSQPARWDHNQGDPGFSDLRLADVQFTASLVKALQTGAIQDAQPLAAALRRVASSQDESGAWPVGPPGMLGSPATYGQVLATHVALHTLKYARLAEHSGNIQRAENWLRQVKVANVPDAAALLLALAGANDPAAVQQRDTSLRLIQRAQTSEGGWGPYPDTPAEPFDTALVLLALAPRQGEPAIAPLVRRGRECLIDLQNPDGSWPETTRPARGESYAQRLSTTGWATLALLATRER